MSIHSTFCGCFVAAAVLCISRPQIATADDFVLSSNGKASAVIVVGKNANEFQTWIASELQNYLRQLTVADFPIQNSNAPQDVARSILLGNPSNNPLIHTAQQQGLVDFRNLQSEGFVLKTIALNGQSTIVAGGNDQTGTMYAVYELLERLGVVFQLTNDIIPQLKPNLSISPLDERIEPALKIRGLHCCHGLRWYMGLDDFRKHIDQMAKLKLNVLNFYWGMGAPWLKFSYDGKVGEIYRTKETNFLAWGRSWHTSSGTGNDVRIGHAAFPDEYLGAPEFADAKTQNEVFTIARDFLREVIRYAHSRNVKVRLTFGEIPYVPPNLVPQATKQRADFVSALRYHGAMMPIGDPALLDIWETAMRTMIETYPEADSYGVWAPEHSTQVGAVRKARLLKEYATARSLIPSVEDINRQGNAMSHTEEDLDNDFAQLCVATELFERVRKHHPDVELGVVTLFRGYLLRAMDALLPKNVWLMNMENCGNHGSMMSFYDGIDDRDLLVMPRIDDDGCELHMQLNAMMYDRDEIISGAAKYNLAGFVGQLNKERGLECNVRYLAEGSWNTDINCQSFYKGYLKRIYGTDAFDTMLQAFLLLEENDRDLVWWGRQDIFIGYGPFATCRLRTNVDYRAAEWNLDRAELEHAIGAKTGESLYWTSRKNLARQFPHLAAMTPSEYWARRAEVCREALILLQQSRATVLPGAREELEYVIFKTDNFIQFFELLGTCHEAQVSLDQAWLARIDSNKVGFRQHLTRCRNAVDRANRIAKAQAGQMLAYSDNETEKHLLLIYNKYVLKSIEDSDLQLQQIEAYHRDLTELPQVRLSSPNSKNTISPQER